MEKSLVETLPPAAQRWLSNVLPAEIKIPSQTRIIQEGEMDIRGKWTQFTAEGLYQGSPLSFNWKARLSIFPGVWIVAEDGQANAEAWGGAKLWGLLSMGRRTDPEVLTAQLVRNIAELAWLPELALSDPNLRWCDAGDDAFEIHGQAGDTDVLVRFEVDEAGDIIKATSPSRPYDIPDGYAFAPWHYQFNDHRQFKHARIPVKAVARFERDDGVWEYFRGQITNVSHDSDPE